VEALTPPELSGSVMGDLQTRRAMVEGIDTEGHFQKIIANVPLAEMDEYSSTLRSLTQGKAKFRMRFHEYQPVPFDIQKKLHEEYAKHAKDEE
jgi:elongation factor G